MLTREQKLLLRHLRREAEAWSLKHEGFAYAGPPGFVLEHGEWFEPRPLPERYPGGLHAKCFGNSIVTAVLDDLVYVEGYAVDVTGKNVWAHAWNVDADGLVDTTWCRTETIGFAGGTPIVVRGTPGGAYFGVRFSVERADDATWNGDATILDDSNRGWPLLRERWQGEPDTPPEYEGTAERLRFLRARDLAGYTAAVG